MAHPTAIITPDLMDTISFRRADGSRHEVAYDGYSIPRRPGLPLSTTTTTTTTSTSTSISTTINTSTVPRYTFTYNPGSHFSPEVPEFDYAAGFGPATALSHGFGAGSGYGSRFGSSYNGGYAFRFTQQHRQEYPRNSVRPFRQDNDEPAEPMMFIRETRRSICNDGRDRSRCSKCKHAISSVQAVPKAAAAAETSFIMSPQRVFRDVVMSDVGEPLRPAVRDALLAAFSGGKSSVTDERTFHLFSRLPYEIRRMIWEAALPSRVLLRDDLCQTTYRSIRKTFRPSNHAYTIEELWQSDLFHVCVEARHVVAAHARGPGYDAGAADNISTGCAAAPMDPLMMNVTTRTKLCSGLDVLYYPWHGTKRARDRGGGGPIRQGPPYMALPDTATLQMQQPHTCVKRPHQTQSPARAPTIAAEAFSAPPQPIPASHRGYSGMGVYCMPGLYQAQDQAAQEEARGQNHADAETGAEVCLACNASTKPPTRTRKQKYITASIAPFPINTIPYGHWASQLRILRVPVTTVALDIAWIDKQHPDTLAWAVGVDLLEPLDCDPDGLYAQPKPVAPECLKVVLADITIPVHIELDKCASAAERQLLERHIFAHPTVSTGYRVQKARGTTDANIRCGGDGGQRDDDKDYLINLNGKDYSVLVDLYDDRRIKELFSLAKDAGSTDRNSHVLNKSAMHQCIQCTRREWQARSRASPTSWSGRFGNLVGGRLQKICQPTILFSIVLAFDNVAV